MIKSSSDKMKKEIQEVFSLYKSYKLTPLISASSNEDAVFRFQEKKRESYLIKCIVI